MHILWLFVPFGLIYLVYRWNRNRLNKPRERWERFWEIRSQAHETHRKGD